MFSPINIILVLIILCFSAVRYVSGDKNVDFFIGLLSLGLLISLIFKKDEKSLKIGLALHVFGFFLSVLIWVLLASLISKLYFNKFILDLLFDFTGIVIFIPLLIVILVSGLWSIKKLDINEISFSNLLFFQIIGSLYPTSIIILIPNSFNLVLAPFRSDYNFIWVDWNIGYIGFVLTEIICIFVVLMWRKIYKHRAI
jgi:hypothetical protein